MALRTITRRLEWDAGHRVLGHEGRCRHLHGHRYVAEVTVAAPELDDLGMVIDFSVLKEKVGGWIDREWDHNMMLHVSDPLAVMWRSGNDRTTVLGDVQKDVFAGKAPYVMKSATRQRRTSRASFSTRRRNSLPERASPCSG
jgi:6-pyruvoyl tetrahydropterin synthase/QueD family protein